MIGLPAAVPPIVVLLAAGSLLLVFGQGAILKRRAFAIGLAVLLLATALAVRAGSTASRSAAVLASDALFVGASVLAGIAIGLAFLTLGSRRDECFRPGELAGLLLLGTAGVMLGAAARDLTLGVVGVELAWFAALPLPFLLAPSHEVRAAMGRRLVVGLVSTGLTIVGALCLAFAKGSSALDVSIASSSSHPAGAAPASLIVAAVLLFAGLAIKLGAVPFHTGTLDAARRFSPLWLMWEAALPRTAALVLWMRLLAGAPEGFVIAGNVLSVMAAFLTLAAAIVLVLHRSELRETLAAVAGGITAAPLLVLAAAHDAGTAPTSIQLPSPWGIAFFAWGSDVVMLGGLMAVLAWLARSDRPILNADDLRGLLATQPAAAGSLALFLAGLAAVPPLPGFWSQALVVLTAWQVRLDPNAAGFAPPHPGFVLALLAAVLFRVAVVAAGARLVGRMLFDGPLAHPRPSGRQAPLAAAVLLGVLSLGLGVLPGPLFERLRTIRPGAAGRAPAPSRGGRGGVAQSSSWPTLPASALRKSTDAGSVGHGAGAL